MCVKRKRERESSSSVPFHALFALFFPGVYSDCTQVTIDVYSYMDHFSSKGSENSGNFKVLLRLTLAMQTEYIFV